MAYKMGYCPQCGDQIMVRDTKGQWNSRKSNFRQADLLMPVGTKIRTIICSKCLLAPDLGKLMDEITNTDSEAGSKLLLTRIKLMGEPVSIQEKV